MAKDHPIVATIPSAQFKRAPGYLYFVDREGDISRRQRNDGHVPSGPHGENHPNEKVVKVGLEKKPGLWYYVEGNNIRALKPRNSKARKPVAKAKPRKK